MRDSDSSPFSGRALARFRRAVVAIAPALGSCVASGILLALAYPTWNFSWLVWIALAPALMSLWWLLPGIGRKRVLNAALCGLFAGLAFFLTNLFWVTEVSVLGWIAISAYLALYFAAWAAIAATAGRPVRLWIGASDVDNGTPLSSRMFASSLESLRVATMNAATWTALEWVRGWMFTGFGWNGLGVALHENHVLIQAADIVGVTGLSFFVMFAVSVATTTVCRIAIEIRHARIRPHADFFATIVIFVALFSYGTNRIPHHTSAFNENPETRNIRCLVIQPNVPQDIKWDELHAPDILNQFYDTTKAAVDEDTALVVWPESAIPFLLQEATTEAYLNDILKLGNFALALGINDSQGKDELYNSIAILKGDFASVRVHRKVHLVPFGEFLPFRKSFPLFEWIAGDEITGDFAAGMATDPLPLPGSPQDSPTEIIPLICFEDTIGELAREFVSPRPQLMLTVTNNGWFGTSANAAQHLANARFRCVELRRPMVRSANTGVTCYIDATGRTISLVHDPVDGSTFTSGALLSQVKVAPDPNPSFYARYGDLFSKGLAVLAAVWICLSLMRSKK